jgi:hypothetical protein
MADFERYSAAWLYDLLKPHLTELIVCVRIFTFFTQVFSQSFTHP